MFRQLAEVYGWPPQIVREWTYYQCRMMVCDEASLTGIQTVAGPVGAAMLNRPHAQKKMLRQFRHTSLKGL